jgi:hypothetical protein
VTRTRLSYLDCTSADTLEQFGKFDARGLGCRDVGGEHFSRAAGLVLGLVIEHFARRDDLADRQRGTVQNANGELTARNEFFHHDFVVETHRTARQFSRNGISFQVSGEDRRFGDDASHSSGKRVAEHRKARRSQLLHYPVGSKP